jgi:hypothetical protein
VKTNQDQTGKSTHERISSRLSFNIVKEEMFREMVDADMQEYEEEVLSSYDDSGRSAIMNFRKGNRMNRDKSKVHKFLN